ncbi:MAG: hypothetical protein GX118_04355 [Arcobacter butzleri]|nr:hypothetical protein [Arcobacteraceae bacterium]MDY0364589.1 hypothetical protein [Arcobacteraceae bacterium]NLO17402.1 hypothetical protein [Aliarcobacter butzleri]
MKRIFFILFFISNILNASLLQDKIVDIIGEVEYNKNKNIINALFQNESRFYINNNLNILTILEELRKNGLLKLKFDNPKDFTIEFETNDPTISSLYIIKNILNSMGYQNYIITNIQKSNQDDFLKIELVLNTEYKIDPLLLTKELQKHNSKVVDLSKKDNQSWKFVVDMFFANIYGTTKINIDESLALAKPMKPYLIEVGFAHEITISCHRLDHWYPVVVFFDEKLNPLSTIEEPIAMKEFTLEIPHGTKYIQINDLYNLNNIKRGLTISIKG